MGALRGLDVDDIDFGDGYVQFRHRPEQDTPLKNGTDGERLAGISDDVVAALQAYIPEGGARPEVTDDYGRKPLFTSAQGRLATSTLRNISYLTTVPCRAGSCPHGKSVKKCEWTGQKTATKCPSWRSPAPDPPGKHHMATEQRHPGRRGGRTCQRVGRDHRRTLRSGRPCRGVPPTTSGEI